jgi:dipeptidyl aminopeptidase/acylaminoacyl peptidase
LDPDGRTLWFTAEDRGSERLYRAREGRVELWIDPLRGLYAQLSGAEGSRETALLALYESATQPPEVVRIDTRQRQHTALTDFTAARLADLDLPPLEELTVESDGRPIHSLLLRPPGFDPNQQYPLFVLIHGGPHIMWRDQFFLRWNYHLLSAPGYALLLTNYRGSTGYGEAFARAIHRDPFKGPADDIHRAADAAIAKHPWIDGQRQCAGGASYGGHLANWLQGTTRRYRCLISHAGLVNAEAQWGTSDMIYQREVSAGGPPWEQGEVWRTQNPIRLAAQFRTPVLLTIGELDYRVPLNNTLEYWSALQRQRVESRLVVFPDENHWILKGGNSRYFYREVHDWLRRWLRAEP